MLLLLIDYRVTVVLVMIIYHCSSLFLSLREPEFDLVPSHFNRKAISNGQIDNMNKTQQLLLNDIIQYNVLQI
jgi:hypothetical protein